MREASFLSQNEKKWRDVEEILNKNSSISPDRAAELFTELTDDLAYAQTHYEKSITTRYLNTLAGGIFQKLTMGRKESISRLVNFWRYEVPMAVGRHHRELLFVFLFFIGTIAIGVVSTHFDETFPRVVLGDRYVDMTIENIESGDPMAVYKDHDSNSMFLFITYNNLRVASYTFIAGIVFSIGSLYYLFMNGIMLGTFQYFFVTKGLFLDSFLAIWIHGTLEISSIVIAGAAGVVLGNSLLFPGTLPRKYSLIRGAKEALKILIGIVPLIVLAGFLESFVTRLTDVSNIIRAGIIFGSLGFVIWYFIIYPIRLKKSDK
ncbi:MAG: stage II sporulation protein M [Bacteroidota bacterium]